MILTSLVTDNVTSHIMGYIGRSPWENSYQAVFPWREQVLWVLVFEYREILPELSHQGTHAHSLNS